MKSLVLRSFVAALLIMPVLAHADTEGEKRAAYLAIRQVVRDNNSAFQAVFTETKSNFLSLRESRITGKGYLTTRGSWNTQSFTYSVKVRRNDYHTRDAELTLANGKKWTSKDDWSKPGGEYIGYFTKPAHSTNFPTGNATFEGYATIPRVDVCIYDRNDRLVTQKQVNVRNNRWNTTFSLDTGTYRAVLGFARMADSDEVRFTIRSGDGGLLPNPGFAEKVSITHPRNNSTLNTMRADIQGTCSADEVRVVVYNSSNREVSRQTLRVRDGRWSMSINLPAGRYRVLAKTLNGRGQDEISFNYKTGSGGGGGNNEDLVTITWPRDNSEVGSMNFDIQGTSRETDVNVKVYNTRGNIMVANHSVAVNNGRWSTTIKNLANGRYRVVVSAGSGRDTDEVTVNRTNN